MKTPKLLLLTVLLFPAAFAAPEAAPPFVPPPTNINVPTVASELALGYSLAIQQMTLKSIVIYLRSDGKIVAIRGLRSAKSMGAVLLIEFSAGDRMAINAEQIVMITDGTRTP